VKDGAQKPTKAKTKTEQPALKMKGLKQETYNNGGGQLVQGT